MGGLTLYTPVGYGRFNPVYTRGLGGVCPVYTRGLGGVCPVYTPGYMGGYTSPGYIPTLHPPGYTLILPSLLCPLLPLLADVRGGGGSPGLTPEETPWVGGLVPALVLKSVTVDGSLCAELLRSSR